MIRRPPRSTLSSSSAASDVYKRQGVDLNRFPGLPEHALTMKDLADAHRLRTHVIGCLETADVTDDPEEKQQLLTFVVVGAGFSGVETVAETRELVRRALKYYTNIKPDEIRFY